MSLARYVLHRLLLVPPTLLAIVALNFAVAQMAPGGPVEHLLATLQGEVQDAAERSQGAAALEGPSAESALRYRGSEGMDPRLVAEIERQFGFDRPAHERFLLMLGRLLRFDLGTSLFLDRPVAALLWERLPVSLSLGLWSTLLTYLLAVPLGIALALRRGGRFDRAATLVTVIAHAIPAMVIAVVLLVLFAGGRFWQVFPPGGLVSEGWQDMAWPARIADWLWHLCLPVAAMVIAGFSSLALLTRNLFLEEIGKTYVLLARAKGLAPRRVLFGHVFRNAMLIVIAGLPGALLGMLLGGGVLIEALFGLQGLGLLGIDAALSRDFPVIFGTLWLATLLGLLLHLASDLLYVAVDPRIGFEARRG
ncbi:ABC transporter permease subunit [Falsiroseomonas selenitidurans]|uniref:ABC transporter permease subunit n=1 Tax=Falsiroseomonas selenitidurans TaxID=2716335 RepID=A0ABX1E4K2_9PROT|nr:ABC transporter permease subunit [Falsiroseomonas selenitidurans]NKC32109.1 ABC transporter permease subunit [Falsiroseomonas selenitidurans]